MYWDFPNRRFVTKAEIAGRYRVCIEAVDKLIRRKSLPYLKQNVRFNNQQDDHLIH